MLSLACCLSLDCFQSSKLKCVNWCGDVKGCDRPTASTEVVPQKEHTVDDAEYSGTPGNVESHASKFEWSHSGEKTEFQHI